MKEIFARRSIRKYTSEKVEKEKIKKIVKAGFAAPSCGNQRISHFIIIKNKEILNSIADIHGYAEALREADTAVAVCANLEEELYQGFWVQDCAAAAENMLTEAVHLGLGAVWLGVYPKERIIKHLNSILELPEKVKVLSLIALGYPAEEKEASDRYLEDKVHFDKW
jgi:nitroreductase